MKKTLFVIAAAIGLVVIASVAIWKSSGDDSRRQGALGTDEPVTLSWHGDWNAEAQYTAGSVVTYEGASYVAEGEAEKLSASTPECAECGWTVMALEGAGTETTKEEPTEPPLRGYEVVYKEASLPAGYTNYLTLKVSCPQGKVPLSGGARSSYPGVKVLWDGPTSTTYEAGVRTGEWGVRFEASPPLTQAQDVGIYAVCASAN